jgi:hypothetical protein
VSECSDASAQFCGRSTVEKANHRHLLLSARRDRPHRRRAAEQRNEFAAFQSIKLHAVPRQPQDTHFAGVSQRLRRPLCNRMPVALYTRGPL